MKLMTIHASKGLEFDSVYVAGVEEGLLPHYYSIESGGRDEIDRIDTVACSELEECERRRRGARPLERGRLPFGVDADDRRRAARLGRHDRR